MNVDLGTILEEELDILNAAVNLCEPTEVDGQGVLVTCVNGVRTWQVTSKDFGITIRGDKHQFDGNFVLPGRLINGAASFGDMEHSCQISIEDNFAIASSSSGSSMRIATATTVPQFQTFEHNNVAKAVVPFRELQRMSSLMGLTPMDYSDYDKMFAQPPAGHISIESGKVNFNRSWQYIGCPDTSLSLSAKTQKSGSFCVNHLAFEMVLNRFWCIHEAEATIGFDPEEGQYLEVRTDRVSIHFKLLLDGAARFFPMVKDYLDTRKIEYLVHDNGQIAMKYKNVVVRAQLFDGVEPILRCTTTVLHNTVESIKLLREINRLNTTRVGTRIWCDNNMVVVGAEMRCDETRHLTPLLDGLVREAYNLGDVLGPMYGGASSAA